MASELSKEGKKTNIKSFCICSYTWVLVLGCHSSLPLTPGTEILRLKEPVAKLSSDFPPRFYSSNASVLFVNFSLLF